MYRGEWQVGRSQDQGRTKSLEPIVGKTSLASRLSSSTGRGGWIATEGLGVFLSCLMRKHCI